MSQSVSTLMTVLVYALLVLIWATTPLAVVWTVQELDAMWALWLRYLVASAIMISMIVLIRGQLPLHATALQSYVAGSLNLIGAQLFIYLAAQSLSSGLMVLIYALAPLLAGLIDHFILRTQRLKIWQWAGMSMAFAGLLLIFSDQSDTAADPFGIVLMLLSVVCYLASIYWVKQINADLPALTQASGALIISALVGCLMLPWIWPDMPTAWPSLQTRLTFLFTVLMSSIVAMLCYFYLIKRLHASTFALNNLINPSIAISIGVIFNQEQLSLYLVWGLGLVMAGLVIYFSGMWLKIFAGRR
ncbi:threonine/homoserine efflux transporter RhtA [Acinetobacter calcoaceticus]|uniref:Threonine/homoserine efflux transporter RhtA n=1 Tax=Acinetobacter calcoaceticus TaxID=471 RepID=A0A4R1Y103_ACICA|nr:threonine/homoserine efflux transporter RhtA [Acinetobacter calcoaceticus]